MAKYKGVDVKVFFIAAVAVVAALAAGGCGQFLKTEKHAPGASLVIEGFSLPESVAKDPDGKNFYVSNIGVKLDPIAKDADGFISRLSPDGRILDKKFLPKDGMLNSPKGLVIIGRVIYIADVDRVVGFNLDTREKVFDLDFSSEKTAFLNDIAVIDDSTIAVSATDVNKVYLVTLGDKPSFRVLQDNVIGANGLFYEAKTRRLYVVGFGEGFKMNGSLGVITMDGGNAAYRALTGALGGLDGIAGLPDGRIIFSDWVAFDKPGVLWIYDPAKGSLTAMSLSEEVKGPADFLYDRETGKVWLPRMTEGKVLIEKIECFFIPAGCLKRP